MARKYRFHRYYGVVFRTTDRQINREDYLTLKEARKRLDMLIQEDDVTDIDIVKRIVYYNRHKGSGSLEEI